MKDGERAGRALSRLGLLTAFVLLALDTHASPSAVRIVRVEQGYRLTLNGEPYFIRGAVTRGFYAGLREAGANSLRAGPERLDEAQRMGFTVLADLALGKPRHGFNYHDAAACQRQAAQVREVVLKYKDHPALLMWALGNEMNVRAAHADEVAIWREVNRLAEMIKQIDDKHPVMTVVGLDAARAVPGIDELCPALDLIGFNAYADMLTLPEDLARAGWKRPYVVTEFGPMGHWQVPRTPWNVPREQSSTEKAETYLAAYRHSIAGRPNCLGSYVFFWEPAHQEKTHTWYGMFLEDGSRTAAVDAITFAWTGKWPANRCPRIAPAGISAAQVDSNGNGAPSLIGDFTAGARLRCEVAADDPDGDPLAIDWELREDHSTVERKWDPIRGYYEDPIPPIAGAVVSRQGATAYIQLPGSPGLYRVFVYVRDGHGGAATANYPLRTR